MILLNIFNFMKEPNFNIRDYLLLILRITYNNNNNKKLENIIHIRIIFYDIIYNYRMLH
jgi:hypothetical protein